jgi:N-acetylmuramoyl-L-alanine amidase
VSRVARTIFVGSGLVLCLSFGLACAPEQRSRIAEIQPYAGQYPTQPTRTVPRPSTPGPRPLGGVKIVVDPGHGGSDPGARGLSASPEKTINLAIAKELAGLLAKHGAHVTITRDDDRFITLDGRADIAERSRTDLFVSIHADSAQRAGASGTTIYIARDATVASRRAAQSIAAAMERAGIECRGLKGAGFRVLVGHSRPAVLVECGFLTNWRDARDLNLPAHQAKIATAIADGIVRHFAALRR